MVAKPKRRGLKPQGKLKSEKQWDASNPRKRRKKKGAHSYQDYRKAWWDGEMERRAVRDKVTAAAAVAWGDDNGPVPIPLDAAGAKVRRTHDAINWGRLLPAAYDSLLSGATSPSAPPSSSSSSSSSPSATSAKWTSQQPPYLV